MPAFGSNDDGMSWEKVKSYLQNPGVAVDNIKDSMNSSLDNADRNLATTSAKTLHLTDPNYQPSENDIQNAMASNKQSQEMAMGMSGSMEDAASTLANKLASGGRFKEGVESLADRLGRLPPEADSSGIRDLVKNTKDAYGNNYLYDDAANEFYKNKIGKDNNWQGILDSLKSK